MLDLNPGATTDEVGCGLDRRSSPFRECLIGSGGVPGEDTGLPAGMADMSGVVLDMLREPHYRDDDQQHDEADDAEQDPGPASTAGRIRGNVDSRDMPGTEAAR